MPANKVNLKIEQGATFNPVFVWKTGDSVETAVPVDLTGCRARAQFRSSVDSATVLCDLTTENDLIVLGGVTGEIYIALDAELTAAFAWEEGVYDLEVEFPDGTVIRRLAGTVKVSPEVTRA